MSVWLVEVLNAWHVCVNKESQPFFFVGNKVSRFVTHHHAGGGRWGSTMSKYEVELPKWQGHPCHLRWRQHNLRW